VHHYTQLLLRLSLAKFFLGLASNYNPPYLYLPHSWKYKCAPPHPINVIFLRRISEKLTIAVPKMAVLGNREYGMSQAVIYQLFVGYMHSSGINSQVI
jgi:hypothetical protein